jgi:hypothetical protein
MMLWCMHEPSKLDECCAIHALLPSTQLFRSPVCNSNEGALLILWLPFYEIRFRRQCLAVCVPARQDKPVEYKTRRRGKLYTQIRLPTALGAPQTCNRLPELTKSTLFPTRCVSYFKTPHQCRLHRLKRPSEVDSRSNRPCTSTSLHLVSFSPWLQVSPFSPRAS